MKTLILKALAIAAIFTFFTVEADAQFKRKVMVSTSEPDAEIYIDGVLMGNGQLEVGVRFNSCLNIVVAKIGYLTIEKNYCNYQGRTKPPKSDFFKMEEDDAYIASVETDLANIDIEIQASKDETESWKLLSQIVTNYFDVIEVTDRETGYLRTAWTVQSFKQNTIRTRLILKLGSSDPLTYKVKIISEFSGQPGTSVKEDQAFKEWDRVLRKYENIIPEMQSRVTQ